MHAVEITETGGPEVLRNVEKPTPSPGPGDVLINAAGSVYLTRPSRPHFIRTHSEFAWRTDELIHAIAAGTIDVIVGQHYPLKDAAQAHRDLEGRRTVGSVVLTP